MIIVASIDQHTASLAEREPFSFTENEVRKALEKISKIAGIDGAVLLSTCNRTELYLSGKSCDATAILCSIRNIDGNLLEQYQDEAAVHHLMKVACGLCSQILCEDQIITQVKTSALLAR
ncbi:MAG: glutamyl-tRNA reductase, partial [Oscillospiraceae bacterium]